jgi:hypothetical protein
VDVIAKLLCEQLDPNALRSRRHNSNIDDHRAILTAQVSELHTLQISIPRYGLVFTPWSDWSGQSNPAWWRSYNNVKHKRSAHFNEATLQNVLNALSALLVLNYYHYSYLLAPTPGMPLSPKDTNYQLRPESMLLRLPDAYYYQPLFAG